MLSPPNDSGMQVTSCGPTWLLVVLDVEVAVAVTVVGATVGGDGAAVGAVDGADGTGVGADGADVGAVGAAVGTAVGRADAQGVFVHWTLLSTTLPFVFVVANVQSTRLLNKPDPPVGIECVWLHGARHTAVSCSDSSLLREGWTRCQAERVAARWLGAKSKANQSHPP